ncbi:hypothetical protein LIER_25738 [Lithospermum erythrorhizon]|uniref:F-box domain-containing protein n=1 Tax=Lithospermum erythrorhizon TaxID=34254 RepID=A0AAV3R8W9_LITER
MSRKFDTGAGTATGFFECFLYDEDSKNKGVELSQRIRLKMNKVASTPKRKPVHPPSPPWLELPEDITEKILRKLGQVGILNAAQYVCTTWRKICRDPTMWRVIHMWRIEDRFIYSSGHMGLVDVFILAVDLSQGQATEISVDCVHNYYLKYIAKRCRNLRCLRLAFSEDLSGRTLRKALKRFPLLEELHLQCIPVRKRFIEAIGQSCPMLKKFAMNRGCRYEAEVSNRSQDALAIAKFMPELHHLQLFGNSLTNEVLDTILNGCPKLESLDLRQCCNLRIEGELGKRCAQQIKILRRPHDPINDYEWLAESADSDDEYDYDEYDYDEYDSDDWEDDSSDSHLSNGASDDSGFPVV